MIALRHTLALCAAGSLAVWLSACSSIQGDSIVDTPMAPPLASAPLNINTQGAIYQAGAPLLLYETPRAQHIGDVLTIRLAESYSGNNSASASASRASSITATAADQSTSAAARLARLFNIGSASTEYKGQGSLSDISGMTGTLAVTVIGTVSGGNLVVSGEKVISMSGNRDRLRLSGIVNPKDIESGNYVASSKVANARIEQAGVGMVSDATTMGWLQRMFLSVLTF
ncbi:flagellar biosynthesis protein FlgH [Burkholderia sp. SRS-W-2-2016]|uniref:flagellar basal body L-ring protein FlgH n=1 Tax=Burkholderia sp. SRS-W-2-2016 TaxID=1926878 RepID=UPI00094B21BD|nr:flagellar basal body L-ring protein FlgH [Burkholderia sp. SRS-W-2-2016]OLL29568.1 flagellar biosynthesis protein FlgH [Burkholderia sp. SRS-W-2-2016]